MKEIQLVMCRGLIELSCHIVKVMCRGLTELSCHIVKLVLD